MRVAATIELSPEEEQNGPIPRPAGFDYLWGDALDEWRRLAPALRIVNLETAITRAGCTWPGIEPQQAKKAQLGVAWQRRPL